MGVSYEDAVSAQEELEAKVFADPNVVSIGVVAEVNELGEQTGNYAVQIGVVSIDIYARAQKCGQSSIPTEFLLRSNDGSTEEKHIHINVVREGKIEALTKVSNGDIPSAKDDLPPHIQTGASYTLRRRPSPCGQSIGHPDVSAGTLGLLVEYVEGDNTGKAYILSNNHVIAANNLASVGDAVTQPGQHDSGIVGRDTIAVLHRWVPLRSSGFNYVDAAIAEVRGGREWSRYVTPYISHIGVPEDIVDPSIGMSVEKVGRTTGYTQGEIISAKFSTKIIYPMGTLTFRNQIRTTSMSKPGDSGSCLVKRGTRSPVGLLFAGSDSASYCSPMRTVLSALSMPHTHQYPSGTICRFDADHSLRILSKRSYATVSAPFFCQGSAIIQNLKRLPTECKVAASVSSIGFYSVAMKLLGSSKRKNKVDGSLFSGMGCQFFKVAPVHVHLATAHKTSTK
tara:strand:- start:329 stop:1684 length:1356 start_codon:yes stop_codon:yes gene_type:complete